MSLRLTRKRVFHAFTSCWVAFMAACASGPIDERLDAGRIDTSTPDALVADTAPQDGATIDAPIFDATSSDAAEQDAQPPAVPDGSVDATPPVPDARPPLNPIATDFLARVSRNHLDSYVNGTRPVVWSEPAILEALMNVWTRTRDVRLLDEVAHHADIILDGRSSVRGTVDVLRGMPVAAWPTDGYNCGHYYAHAVHSGVIAHPIAWFARVVLEDPGIAPHHVARAERYVVAADAALAVHNDQFSNNGDEGRYRVPTNIGTLSNCPDNTSFNTLGGEPLPYNQMLGPGRAHLEIARAMDAQMAGDGNHHRDRAARLARYFRSALERSGDMYLWEYVLNGRREDTAHAALVIRFVVEAYEAGLVFDDTHLSRFVETFQFLSADMDAVRSHLDATTTGEPSNRWQSGVVRWTPLSIANRIVYDRARAIYYDANGASLTGQSQLIRFKPDAFEYPISGDAYQGLPVLRPRNAMFPSSAAGLYRPPETDLVDLNGTSLSSCAQWTFEQNYSPGPLQVRYRSTTANIAGDSCIGSACDTDIGILLFTSSNGSNWERVSAPTPTDAYVNHTITVPAFRHVMACRGGTGHARRNLQVSFVRVMPR